MPFAPLSIRHGKVLYLNFAKKKKKPYTIQIVFIYLFILFYALIVGTEEF